MIVCLLPFISALDEQLPSLSTSVQIKRSFENAAASVGIPFPWALRQSQGSITWWETSAHIAKYYNSSSQSFIILDLVYVRTER